MGSHTSLRDKYLSLPPEVRRQHFLGTRDAAIWAGVSQRTLQLWIRLGEVHALQVGHRYLVYLPSLVEKFRDPLE